MKRGFSEEQIIGFLKEQEAGFSARELCRKPGMSDASFYKWKAKFDGTEVSEARRLRDLEVENAKLKKLVALFKAFGLSERYACRLASAAR